MNRIYLSPPHMGGQEQARIAEAFDSNWIAPLGPFVDKFEDDLKKYIGKDHCCATASGTSALHLALLTLGIKNGDRVYCSDLTFSASANVIRYCNATPVFIDSNRETWNMDPRILADALRCDARRKTLPKAIIVVDLYGISAEYSEICKLAEEYEIPIVEDSAEALGSLYDGKKCGTFGKISIFSFNGNKIITTSGGGALLSNDEAIIKHARFLATQAREPFPYYFHKEIGYNYRLSNLLAAVGCAQLEVLPSRIEKRREINARYREELADIKGVSFMPENGPRKSNCWLTVLQIEKEQFGMSPEEIRLEIEKENIECRAMWKPMHSQPIYFECEYFGGSVSDRLFEKGLCIPSGSSLSYDDQSRVIATLKKLAR